MDEPTSMPMTVAFDLVVDALSIICPAVASAQPASVAAIQVPSSHHHNHRLQQHRHHHNYRHHHYHQQQHLHHRRRRRQQLELGHLACIVTQHGMEERREEERKGAHVM